MYEKSVFVFDVSLCVGKNELFCLISFIVV